MAGACFLRLWKRTRDRLFLFLAGGSWMLSANWFGLAAVAASPGVHGRLRLIRLVAFALVGPGLVDKNQRRRRGGGGS